MLRRLCIILAATAATAGTALAADPDSGTVSASSPTVTWKGEAFGPMGIAYSEGTGGDCEAPTCDPFALEVAEAGTTLTFTVSTSNYSNVEFEVEKPDGTRVYETSDENEDTRKTVIKAPAKGAYKVYVWAYGIAPEPMRYDATATLATAAAAAPATDPPASSPPPAGAPPAGSPPPPQSGPPAAAPATRMTVKARGGSARKLNRRRKVVATIRPSAPVTGVAVQLLRGKTAVAIGKAARVERSGRVTLKLRKRLKAGRYTLFAAAKDAQGRAVTAKSSLRVKR